MWTGGRCATRSKREETCGKPLHKRKLARPVQTAVQAAAAAAMDPLDVPWDDWVREEEEEAPRDWEPPSDSEEGEPPAPEEESVPPSPKAEPEEGEAAEDGGDEEEAEEEEEMEESWEYQPPSAPPSRMPPASSVDGSESESDVAGVPQPDFILEPPDEAAPPAAAPPMEQVEEEEEGDVDFQLEEDEPRDDDDDESVKSFDLIRAPKFAAPAGHKPGAGLKVTKLPTPARYGADALADEREHAFQNDLPALRAQLRALGPVGAQLQTLAIRHASLAKRMHKHTPHADRQTVSEHDWWNCLLESLGLPSLLALGNALAAPVR